MLSPLRDGKFSTSSVALELSSRLHSPDEGNSGGKIAPEVRELQVFRRSKSSQLCFPTSEDKHDAKVATAETLRLAYLGAQRSRGSKQNYLTLTCLGLSGGK